MEESLIGKKIDVKIEDINSEGLGVAKVDGYTLFIDNALPGERCYVEIVEQGKSFGIAKCLGVRDESIYRVKPLCEHFGICGGCDLMHLDNKAQLLYKKNKVVETIKRIGGIENVPVDQMVGMDNPYYYRNKIQMTFGFNRQNGKITCGYYRKKTHDVINIDKCFLQDDKTSEILKFIRNICNEFKISSYNEETHKGTLRNILIRKNKKNEYMVVFITNVNELYCAEMLVNKITSRYSEVKSIYQNINMKHNNVILGEKSKLLYGDKYLIEELCGLKFNVAYQSFFQVNTVQTEKLYSIVLDYAQNAGNINIIDAYCGVGTISLLLSQSFKYVYGIEIVPEAIKNAKENAKINNIDNVEFMVGKVEEVIENYLKDKNINTIVFDPPRKGLDKTVVDNVLNSNITNIVYVSCNVSTLARDIKLLSEQFSLVKCSIVDMFCQTVGVETIVLLSRKS